MVLEENPLYVGDPKRGVSSHSTFKKSNGSVKFKVIINVIIAQKDKFIGISGRFPLSVDWVGHQVKIIRVD